MQMEKVSDVLSRVTASSDFPYFAGSPEQWLDLINSKMQSSGFWRLLDDIMINGIEEPIYVAHDGYLGEGHHRLVIAILLALDTVPVKRDESEHFDTWRISAHNL